MADNGVPSQQPQPQTPPCQEQHPERAKTSFGNINKMKKVIKNDNRFIFNLILNSTPRLDKDQKYQTKVQMRKDVFDLSIFLVVLILF